jgi:hypothetical protein
MAEMLDGTEVPLNEGALAGSAKSQSHLIFRFDLGGITVFDRASWQALDEGICVISFVGLLSVFCRRGWLQARQEP